MQTTMQDLDGWVNLYGQVGDAPSILKSLLSRVLGRRATGPRDPYPICQNFIIQNVTRKVSSLMNVRNDLKCMDKHHIIHII